MKEIGVFIIIIFIILNTFGELYNIKNFGEKGNIAGVIGCIFSMIVMNCILLSLGKYFSTI